MCVLSILQVFDPHFAPSVSIAKPMFSDRRISLVSAEIHTPLENCGVNVFMKPGVSPASPHNDHAIHSFKQSNGEHMDACSPYITLDDNQMKLSGPLAAVRDEMIHLELEESSSMSDYRPSKFDTIHPISDDMVQLDLLEDEEQSGDTSTQCQGYVIITIASQKNNQDQRFPFTSMADTLFPQPLCSPVAMDEAVEDTISDLGALEEDGILLVGGKLPPVYPANARSDENIDVGVTAPELHAEGYERIGHQLPTSILNDEEFSTLVEGDTTVSQDNDDDSCTFDSDKGSVVSVDFTGEISEPQNHSLALVHGNANGYSWIRSWH